MNPTFEEWFAHKYKAAARDSSDEELGNAVEAARVQVMQALSLFNRLSGALTMRDVARETWNFCTLDSARRHGAAITAASEARMAAALAELARQEIGAAGSKKAPRKARRRK